MCKVCELKEKQKTPITEMGKLMQKRERALLMGKYDEAKELKSMVLDVMTVILKLQEEVPNLLNDDADFEVILCLLQKRKGDIRVRY